MRQQSTKPHRRTRSNPIGHESLRPSNRMERRLAELLRDLAQILVCGGFGVVALNKLAKQAYVDAAMSLERGRGRRQNNARIAAITGLTRTEVSQLSRSQMTLGATPSNRAQRVSFGWMSDREYCARPGVPNVLPFDGQRASFQKLVRKYSGDIPARALLSEMLRLGMAREEPENKIRLLRADSAVPNQAIASLGAISPWIKFFAGGPNDHAIDADTVWITLNFQSIPQLHSAVREIQGRATALVNSIKELGQLEGRRPASYKLQISIGLATRMPKVGSPGKIKRMK